MLGSDWANILLGIGGTVLILVAMFDALMTTVVPSGGGPLTMIISRWIWSVILRLDRLWSLPLLRVAGGPLILLVAIASWIVLLWAGWTMLFCSASQAVVDSHTQAPASVASRIYFTGYTIFTLGIGDYVPLGAGWSVATALAALNGLFLVTLSITYLLPVLSAAVEKRQIAARIADLGATPQQIVINAWDGQSFSHLSQQLIQLGSMIELHAQRHVAYPVLHYFSSTDRRSAFAVNVAMLDEALTILRYGVAPEHCPPSIVREPVRKAIWGHLMMLAGNFVTPTEQAPPLTEIEALAQAGVPVVSRQAFEQEVQALDKHRRRLLGMVSDAGWTWGDVTAAGEDYLPEFMQ